MGRNSTSLKELTDGLYEKISTSLTELTDAWHGLYSLVPEPRKVEDDAEDEDADYGRLSERHPDDLSGSQRVNYGKISEKQTFRDIYTLLHSCLISK